MNKKSIIICSLAVILLVLGMTVIYTFSKPIEVQESIIRGFVNVPANNYSSVNYERSISATYYFQVNSSKGTVEVFLLNSNEPYMYVNGIATEIRFVSGDCCFNGSSGQFGYLMLTDIKDYSGFLFLYNPDSFDKQVDYSIYRNWSYNNNVALGAGIVLFIVGIALLFVTVLKNKLQHFDANLTQELNGK